MQIWWGGGEHVEKEVWSQSHSSAYRVGLIHSPSGFRAFRVPSLNTHDFFFMITATQKPTFKVRGVGLLIPLLYLSKWFVWKHTKRNTGDAPRRFDCLRRRSVDPRAPGNPAFSVTEIRNGRDVITCATVSPFAKAWVFLLMYLQHIFPFRYKIPRNAEFMSPRTTLWKIVKIRRQRKA